MFLGKGLGLGRLGFETAWAEENKERLDTWCARLLVVKGAGTEGW